MLSGKSAPLSARADWPNRRARRSALKLGRLTLTKPAAPPAVPPPVQFVLMPAVAVGSNVVIDLVVGEQTTRLTIARDNAEAHCASIIEALNVIDGQPTETEDELSADAAAMLAESQAAVNGNPVP